MAPRSVQILTKYRKNDLVLKTGPLFFGRVAEITHATYKRESSLSMDTMGCGDYLDDVGRRRENRKSSPEKWKSYFSSVSFSLKWLCCKTTATSQKKKERFRIRLSTYPNIKLPTLILRQSSHTAS